MAARDAVGEEDEADAAGDGGERDSEEVLFGLFDENIEDGVAGVRCISLPDREAYGFPLGYGRCAAGKG